MKAGYFPACSPSLLLAADVRGAETFDEAMARAALDYAERLRQASDELTQTRERIAREKAPLLRPCGPRRTAIIAAESEITRLETAQEQSQEKHRQVLRDADSLRKNVSYVGTLAHDSLKAYERRTGAGRGASRLPGGSRRCSRKLEDPAAIPGRTDARSKRRISCWNGCSRRSAATPPREARMVE